LNTAIASGIHFQVFVSESQPNCDGVVTAQQLVKSGIKVTLGLDAAIGDLVSRSDLMLTGVEAITSQGSAICKVGTYLAALAASQNGIPYYALADTYKFVPPLMTSFFDTPESLNQPDLFRSRKIEGIQFCEQLFDTTPPQFITGIVTEKGVISPMACRNILREISSGERINHLIKCARAVELEH
jgi:translation initiation factor 2B subunit (eIF-2B alpha/beta/delta family)